MYTETLRIFAVIAILLTGLAGGVLSRLMSAGTRSERPLSPGAVIDILGEEFAQPDRRWLKFGDVSLGLRLMAVVAIWT